MDGAAPLVDYADVSEVMTIVGKFISQRDMLSFSIDQQLKIIRGNYEEAANQILTFVKNKHYFKMKHKSRGTDKDTTYRSNDNKSYSNITLQLSLKANLSAYDRAQN